MRHDHDDPSEFEAGCPACELDEVSLQDTGRPWRARLAELTGVERVTSRFLRSAS